MSGARPGFGVGAVVRGQRRPVPGQLSLLPGCLDAQDRAVLAFARDHHLQGRVGARVQAQLGMTQTRYYQLLLRLLDRVEVAEAEPELVAGLVALRDGRRRRLARQGRAEQGCGGPVAPMASSITPTQTGVRRGRWRWDSG